MTPAEAQRLQDGARAAGDWLIWFVTNDPDHPGRVVAWAVKADSSGGKRRGELVADMLDELRAMLPAGLTRRDRTSAMPITVLETWD